jgi:hypothetical protein
MKKKILLPLTLLLPLSLGACGNLFKGLSTPEGDEQLLIAARGCMDRGDYNCALEYYQALSSSYGDVKVNETSLAKLANANIFKMSDLIGALGSSRGDGASFTTMANTIASRGVANATNRLLIQTTFADNNAIVNPKLRAFSKFISSISMVNAVLAEVAGTDQILTASDIVANPTACKSAAGNACANPVDPAFSNCAKPASSNVVVGTALTNGLEASTGWDGTATLMQFIKAASDADAQAAIFTGSSSNSGIFSAIDSLSGLGALADPCIRQSLMNTLGL